MFLQAQLDPNVPTNIPPGQLDDFKTFLDGVMNTLIGTNGPTLLDAGRDLWTGLAAIIVVWTGVKIAMSGNFQPWEVVRLIIGLWIPWVMLHFYDTPLPTPADSFTFPSMIVGGGNWLMNFFLADTVSSVRTELSNMITNHVANITQAWEGYSLYDLFVSGASAAVTLAMSTAILSLTGALLVLLFCVTYAQILWAQIAIAILVFLGPLLIPWLLFEPLSFLFWGWFRSLITFCLYGALAGAVMRVFMGVSIGYITTFSQQTLTFDLVTMGGWLLIVLPLFIAGILSSLKVGELASMLVTGSAVTSSGITGIGMMAASGGAAGGAVGAGAARAARPAASAAVGAPGA